MSTFQDDRTPLLGSIGRTILAMAVIVVVIVASFRLGGVWFWFAVAFAFGWLYWSKRARAASDAVTCPVASSHGYVELFGKAGPSSEGALRDPVTDEPCVWFGVVTERRRETKWGEEWDEIKRASSSREFVLRDESGECRVSPLGAQFELSKVLLVQAGEEMRHRVWRISAGDPLYVLGEFHPLLQRLGQPGGGRVFMIADQPPHAFERDLKDKSFGYGLVAIVLGIVIVLIMLSGCTSGNHADERERRSRGREVGYTTRFTTAQLEKEARELAALLEEKDRDQRWRSELTKWNALKRERATSARARKAAELQTNAAEIRRLREELTMIALLRSRGAHAPSGTIPDLLEVMDDGKTTVVGNRSGRPLTVRVMRSGTYPRRQETFWCVTFAKRKGDTKYEGVRLAPRESELFSISEYWPCHFVEVTKVEFEVRDDNGLVWGNESVLARLEKLAREDLAKLEEKVPESEAQVESAN